MAQDSEASLAGVEAEASKADKNLKKSLSRQAIFFLAFGGMVGSGWLFAAPAAAFYAGPASIFSWVITGVIMVFVLLTFTEITSYIPKSGALVRYPAYTYGPQTTFFVGWLYFISALVTPSVEGLAVAGYLSAYIPGIYHGLSLSPLGIGIAAIFVFVMFLVNYFGVKLLGLVNTGIGYWKLIIPVLTFLFLLFFALHGANFGFSGLSSGGSFMPYGLDGVFYAIPAAGIIWAVEGFRQPIEYSGETRLSGRTIMKTAVAAFAGVIALYVFLQIAFLGAVNWSAVGLSPGDWIGLQNTGYYATPYFTALKLSGVPLLGAFASLLLVDAWISPTGTGWVYFGNSVRDLYGYGALGFFPKGFLTLNKYKVPMLGLIVTVVASVLFLLPFPSWYAIIGFAGVTAVLAYVLGGPMVNILRKHMPPLNEAVRIPFVRIAGLISWSGGILIIYWSGFYTVWATFTFGFVVLPLIYFTYLISNKIIKNKARSRGLGISQFVISLALSIFGYYYLMAPPASQTTSASIEYFLIYAVGFGLTIYVITWLTSKSVDPRDKKMATSFYWLVTLELSLLVISFFGSFGNVVYIQFPWDTILMVIVSVPIYFWAIASGFETGYLKEHKRQMAAEKTE